MCGEKLAAAVEAGAQTLVIPADNWEEGFAKLPAAVYPVKDIAEVMRIAFDIPREAEWIDGIIPIGGCPACHRRLNQTEAGAPARSGRP